MASRLLRAAGGDPGDVDEHDGQAARAEGVGQRLRPLDHLSDRMDAGRADDALLKVDDEERGIRIEGRQGHGARLSASGWGAGRITSRRGSRQSSASRLSSFDGGGEVVLFLGRQAHLDLSGEPVLPRRAPFLEPRPAGRRERKQGLSPVHRVRRAAHQAGGLERGHDRSHRLRTHALRSRKARGRGGTVPLEAKQGRDLGRPEVSDIRLVAQAAPEFADDGRGVRRTRWTPARFEARRVDRSCRHITYIQDRL